MKYLFKINRLFFIFILIPVFVAGASFAENRTDVIGQALDHYEYGQWGAASNSFSRSDVSLRDSIDISSGFFLVQEPSPISPGPEDFSEILLEEDIPEDLRRVLENPDQIRKDQPVPEIDLEPVPELNKINNTAEDGDPSIFDMDMPVESTSSVEDAVIDHLQLKDMAVVDILKLLSQKSGLNIIAGKNIKGTVSIYLKNVKLQDALRIILDSNDLAYKEEDGIVRVMPADEFEKRYGYVFGGNTHTRVMHLTYAKVQDIASVLEQIKSSSGKIIVDEKSNTLIVMDTIEKLDMIKGLLVEIDVPVEVEVFDLNYASAKNLIEKIDPFLTQGIGNAKFDERSNKIIVTDVVEKIAEIRRVVEAFDVKEQQVLIEAKIIQIELTDNFELGVDWQAIFTGLDNLNVQMDFDVFDGEEVNKSLFTVGTIAHNSYAATLEALKSVGDTNVLSSPSIIVLNNQEAKILVGSTQPYVTSTTTTPSSGPTTTAETINFIDVGVKLYVTPIVHRDGFITMKIRPEVSSVLSVVETSGGNEIPVVKTSEAETTVRIKDGVTIVIGGLIEDSNSDTRKKVPILGDIPLLGAVFRNQDMSSTKTEIAIFLTPTIVSGEESLTPDLAPFVDNDLY